MRNKRRYKFRHSGKAEINVVPFLDVLLVLLLIFMISAPVINKSLEVRLPTSDVKSPQQNNKNKILLLEVIAPDQYNLLVDKTKYPNATPQLITEQSKILLSNSGQEKYIFQIAGSATLDYQSLIKGMDILKKAGVTEIGLITRPLK